jgi:hypothetical protein
MSAPTNETADAARTSVAETTADTDEAPDEAPGEDVRAHLVDVADGCGCAEVWEHLSDEREE